MVIFSPLRARKSDTYRYRNSWKRDYFRERESLKKKQRTEPKKDAKRINSDNFPRSNREKWNIGRKIISQHHNYFAFWWHQ